MLNKKLVGLFLVLVISISSMVLVSATDIDKPYKSSIVAPVGVTLVND